jgi:hypothetical protein
MVTACANNAMPIQDYHNYSSRSLEDTIEYVLQRLERVRRHGQDRYTASCPAHEDHSPSLSVTLLYDRILVHCHAGCSLEKITAALGIVVADLFDGSRRHITHDLQADLRRQAAQAFASWREKELVRCAVELRTRDQKIIAIDNRVAYGELTTDAAVELLTPLYQGYSDLERRFEVLNIGTDREALEVYRSSELPMITPSHSPARAPMTEAEVQAWTAKLERYFRSGVDYGQ